MKTQLLFALLLFTFLSCNKKNDITPTTPQGYLNQYIGDYYCSAHYSSYAGSQSDYYTFKTLLVYKYYSDSSILICGSGLFIDTIGATLYSDKTFRSGGYYGMITIGNFANDSIYFYQGESSFGSYQFWDLKGKKQ